MLNRLKEITLFKEKFPLRCKLHYFSSLYFFPPVEKSSILQGTYIMNVFFLHTGYMYNLIPDTC